MKKVLIFLFSLLFIYGCKKDSDDSDSAERNTYSEDSSPSFEEIILLLNVRTSDTSYLVIDRIDSVNLFLNTKYWAKVNSSVVDTSKISKFKVGSRFFSRQKINYLVMAKQDVQKLDFLTAGEFSQYLNAALNLPTGEYACFIHSFIIPDGQSGSIYYPFVYTTFRIDSGMKTKYIGEISLLIN